MAEPYGYILSLPSGRYIDFENYMSNEWIFVEPIARVGLKNNRKALCLIIEGGKFLRYLASGRQGRSAGTKLRGLKITEGFKFENEITTNQIIEQLPIMERDRYREMFRSGGQLGERDINTINDIIINMAPSIGGYLEKFGMDKEAKLKKISDGEKNNLALQKMAVLTALKIAGIPSDVILNWDVAGDENPKSFLEGLAGVRLHEDQMIINDFGNIPGFEEIKKYQYAATEFRSESTKLTLFMANKLPLERLTGADLIYLNETFRSFIMVQYKAMERIGGECIYRLPNQQLQEEIARMEKINALLQGLPSQANKEDYRICLNPFFIKLCSRVELDLNNTSLVSGMYIPLDYWKILASDNTLVGRRGGRIITFRNVKRHIDNTEFVRMVSKAWVGTNADQTKMIGTLIGETISSGKAVTFAIKTDFPPDGCPGDS